MPFKKGNTFGRVSKKGIVKKSTIVKSKLGLKNLESMKSLVIENWYQLLTSDSKKDRMYASKEISKYIFPTKKESIQMNYSLEDYIKEIEQEKKMLLPEHEQIKEIEQNSSDESIGIVQYPETVKEISNSCNPETDKQTTAIQINNS